MSYKIIAFDGGGIRGLVSAMLLENLEQSGDFVKNTNLYAGTSTGSFIALALANGNKLDDILDLYKTNGELIFDDAPIDWHCANPLTLEQQTALDNAAPQDAQGARETIKSIFQAKYRPANLKAELGKIFGAGKLCELPRSGPQVVVNSLQLWSDGKQQWAPVAIGSGRKDPFAEMHMIDAAMCSGAAPTYFPPHCPETKPNQDWGFFADGGMFANNPSASAIAYAVENFGASLAEMRVLSIGTGNVRAGLSQKAIGRPECWGAWQWLKPYSSGNGAVPAAPLIEAALSASAAACEQYARQMLGQRFIRANLELKQPYALDNWRDIAQLEEAVHTYVMTDEWKAVTDAVCQYWNSPDPLASPAATEKRVPQKSWFASFFA